jgi:hypothetical protein
MPPVDRIRDPAPGSLQGRETLAGELPLERRHPSGLDFLITRPPHLPFDFAEQMTQAPVPNRFRNDLLNFQCSFLRG